MGARRERRRGDRRHLLKPQILGIGTGRSGTRFVASHLAQKYGMCGHERAYNQHGFHGWGKYPAEVSWMAVPLLTEYPSEAEETVHYVRDPLSVIRSRYRVGFDPKDWKVLDPWLPHLHAIEDPLEQTVRVYFSLFLAAEDYADRWERVEDIGPNEGENHHSEWSKRRELDLTYDDLPTAISSIAREYGYL